MIQPFYGPEAVRAAAVTGDDWNETFGSDPQWTSFGSDPLHSFSHDASAGVVQFTADGDAASDELHVRPLDGYYHNQADITLTASIALDELGTRSAFSPIVLARVEDGALDDDNRFALTFHATDGTEPLGETHRWSATLVDDCGSSKWSSPATDWAPGTRVVDIQVDYEAASGDWTIEIMDLNGAGITLTRGFDNTQPVATCEHFYFNHVGVALVAPTGGNVIDLASPVEGLLLEYGGSQQINRAPVPLLYIAPTPPAESHQRWYYDLNGDSMVEIPVDLSASWDLEGGISEYQFYVGGAKHASAAAEWEVVTPANGGVTLGTCSPYVQGSSLVSQAYVVDEDGDRSLGGVDNDPRLLLHVNGAPTAFMISQYFAGSYDWDGDGTHPVTLRDAGSRDHRCQPGGYIAERSWQLDGVEISTALHAGAVSVPADGQTKVAKLTVTDQGGLSDSVTRNIKINPNRDPVLFASATVCHIGACGFTTQGSYDPDQWQGGYPSDAKLTYEYAFEDGTTVTTQETEIIHAFDELGIQEVCVTATDVGNAETSTCFLVAPAFTEDWESSVHAQPALSYRGTNHGPEWEVTSRCAQKPTGGANVLAYHNIENSGSTCDYSNGIDYHYGWATIEVGIPAGDAGDVVTMRFNHRLDLDNLDVPRGTGQYTDAAAVYLCPSATSSLTSCSTLKTFEAGNYDDDAWTNCQLAYTLPSTSGITTQHLRFVFDGNGLADNGAGWFIDDMFVYPGQPDGCSGDPPLYTLSAST